MANNSLTAQYDALPRLLRIILQAVLGAFVGGIYRIIRYTETKNIVTLVAGIAALIPPIDFVFWIVDLLTVITNDTYTILVD